MLGIISLILFVLLMLALAFWLGREREKRRAEVSALQERLVAVEGVQRLVPGVTPGEKDWFVTVGGEQVEIRAFSGAEFFEAFEELPGFVFAYAASKGQGETLTKDDLEAVQARARDWIRRCALKEVALDRLTLPEAEHAITHIAELNGITAQLREFFRQRLETLDTPRPGRTALRGTTVGDRGPTLN